MPHRCGVRLARLRCRDRLLRSGAGRRIMFQNVPIDRSENEGGRDAEWHPRTAERGRARASRSERRMLLRIRSG